MEVLDDFDRNPDALVHELTLWPADPSKKPRNVIAVRGPWRLLQRRLYLNLLLPRMAASAFSHGGVKGRCPATNARAHIGSTYAFVTDISGFFPAISCHRVNDLFLRQACSSEVASILTRLCTYDFHLALGLVTSPILANELFKPIDWRIADACRKMGLTYTRFVDDITISGKFDLERSGIRGVVENIVDRHGFKLAASKTGCGRLDRRAHLRSACPPAGSADQAACGRFDQDITITGVRLKKYHLDVPRKYVNEVERLISDHTSLAHDGKFTGPLLTEGELFGKSHYVCAMNPGRRRSILGKLKAIEWDKVMNNAAARELVRTRDRLRPRGDKRPDCTEDLPQVVSARRFQEYLLTASVDRAEAPF
jgi:hypothetical protein